MPFNKHRMLDKSCSRILHEGTRNVCQKSQRSFWNVRGFYQFLEWNHAILIESWVVWTHASKSEVVLFDQGTFTNNPQTKYILRKSMLSKQLGFLFILEPLIYLCIYVCMYTWWFKFLTEYIECIICIYDVPHTSLLFDNPFSWNFVCQTKRTKQILNSSET